MNRVLVTQVGTPPGWRIGKQIQTFSRQLIPRYWAVQRFCDLVNRFVHLSHPLTSVVTTNMVEWLDLAIARDMEESATSMSTVDIAQRQPSALASVPAPVQSPLQAAATEQNIRREVTLMGLPAEIRLKIYEYVAADEYDVDNTALPFDRFYTRPEYTWTGPSLYASRHINDLSSQWIYTCRQMLEEGRWVVVKAQMARTAKEFYDYCYSTPKDRSFHGA